MGLVKYILYHPKFEPKGKEFEKREYDYKLSKNRGWTTEPIKSRNANKSNADIREVKGKDEEE